ncbi:MAG: hypothetical protein J7639_05945 [Paenibacillaceae bacterium]|nr:hypothetical protein [Paenibacillaceae bacterium]
MSDNGFVKTMETIFKPVALPIIRNLLKPLRDLKKLPGIIIKKIQNFFKTLLGTKETSLQNYVSIGRYYVSKRVVAFAFLGVLVLSFFLFIKPPPLVKKWFYPTPVLREASSQAAKFSGNAKVLPPTGKVVRYKGSLKDGLYAGQGKLYADNGQLLYEGEFDKGLKAGGTLYDDKGTLLYKGQFAADTMNGQGMDFYPDGKIRYVGEFQNGKIGGTGKLFFPSGDLQYEGAFSAGTYGGEGKLYNESGALLYEGAFAEGKYNGAGKLYGANKAIVYEGGFKSGLYAGDGTELYPNGFVKYKGAFAAGVYNGEGASFTDAGVPIYKGTFAGGKPNGVGEAYDKEGKPVYRGEFANGAYEGVGTLLDQDGGTVVKAFFAAGHVQLQNFLGLPSKKIEEMLGKPTEVVAPDSAVASGDETDAAGSADGAAATASGAAAAGSTTAAAGSAATASTGAAGTTAAPVAGAAATTAAADPSAAAASSEIVKLTMNYNEQQMAFTIETTPENPKEAIVTGVAIWGSKPLSVFVPEIETFADPNKPNALGYNQLELKRDAGSDAYLNVYFKDTFMYTVTHHRKTGTANQLEIGRISKE